MVKSRLCFLDFPGGSEVKASAYNAGDLGWEDPLEKKMATHSSILAWKIPWTEKLCGLYSSKGHKELDATESVGEKFPGFGRESPCFTDKKIEVSESILVPWQMR